MLFSLAEKHERSYLFRVSKGELTHDRAVGCALRQASRDGLDGLSIGALASELGLSKSGVFRHFGSKDALQLQVLQAAVERFAEIVIRPAIAKERGLPRLKALVERWLTWANDPEMPGGCLIVAASIELDDRPGPQRDFLVAAQREWLKTLARAVRLSIEQGHLRADTSPEQIAFELEALLLGYHHSRRLMNDATADARVRRAVQRVIESVKVVDISPRRTARARRA